MNIISGLYKSRVILMPRGVKIRPTSNKVREALFNIIGTKSIDAAVLDIFAGSGALGIEALSRGAAKAVFIENNARCVAAIKDNLKAVGVTKDAEVLQANALNAVKKFHGETKFDIIFMDPPYFGGWIKNLLIKLDHYDILNNLGVCICEHDKREELPQEIGRLVRFRQCRYGDTVLSFYNVRS